MRTLSWILTLVLLAVVTGCGDGRELTEPDAPTAQPGALIAAPSADGFAFLPPLGGPVQPEAPLQGDLLPFLTVEVCELDNDVCALVIESFDHRGDGPRKLRIEDGHFHVNWKVDRHLDPDAAYGLRVRVGPLELGQVPVGVRRRGGPRADGVAVQPGRTLPVKFLVEASPRWSGLSADLSFPTPVAVAGQVVELSGISAPADAEVDILIDGRVAPAIQTGDGSLLAGVPLFLDGGAWPSPPSGALDVLIFLDGEPVAWAKSVIEVTPPPEAPGSSAEALAKMGSIAEAWSTKTGGFENPSLQEAWATSASAALAALVHGESDVSLQTALGSADPETLRLLDAWFASSGVLEALDEYATALEIVVGMTAGTTAGTTAGSGASAMQANMQTDMQAALAVGDVGTQWPANYLAEKMQLAMVAREFGQTALNGAATDLGYVGIAASILAPYVTAPAIGATGAVVGLLDFVANKLLIATLPSQVDTLTLDIPDAVLEPGEQTIADVRIQASNQPPAIGFQEVIAQIISIAGAAAGTAPADDLADFLINAVDVFKSTLQAQFASYAAAHPELNLDFTTNVPHMTWWATVFDETLVEPGTLAPQLLTPAADGVDWVAADDAFGEGRVYAAISASTDSYRLDLPPGFSYNGGAFGEDIVQTDPVTVRVVGDLVLAVSFADEIAPDGFNALEARAGYLTADEDTVWTGGIWIELAVDGGTVEESEGPTDIDGQFITLARLDDGSDEITITVTAYDDAAQSVSRTVSARTTDLDGEVGPVYVGPYRSIETAACYGEEYVSSDAPAWIESEEEGVLTLVRFVTSYRYSSGERRGAWRYRIFEGTVSGATFEGEYIGFGDRYDDGSSDEWIYRQDWVADDRLTVTFGPDRLTADGRMTHEDGCDYEEFEMVNEGAREPVDLTGTWTLTGGANETVWQLTQTGDRISGTTTDVNGNSYRVHGSVVGNGAVGIWKVKIGYYGSSPSGFGGLISEDGSTITTRHGQSMVRQ